MKRILIVTNRVPCALNDGGAMAMEAIIQGYKNAGWAVDLLSMNTTKHWQNEKEVLNHYHDLNSCTLLPFDNSLKPIKLLKNLVFSKLPEHVTRFYSLSFDKILQKKLLEFQPDVVQLESIFLGSYLKTIRQNSRAKTNLRLHNIEFQIWERLAKNTPWYYKKIYLKLLAKRIKSYEFQIWNEVDYLLPITLEDEKTVEQSGCKTPSKYIPFTIDFPEYTVQNINLNAYHIGAMDWQPNIEAMLWMVKTIFPEIKKKIPEFQFFIGGKNMNKTDFLSPIEGLHYIGTVANVSAFIKDKSILIVPLKSGSGVRIKIIEAMAAGKIVIATESAIQGIAAINDVHYLSANTPAEFTEKVDWINQNKMLAEKMAENAYQFAKNNYSHAILPQLLNSL